MVKQEVLLACQWVTISDSISLIVGAHVGASSGDFVSVSVSLIIGAFVGDFDVRWNFDIF